MSDNRSSSTLTEPSGTSSSITSQTKYRRTTLKEFEEALGEQGMDSAVAVLEKLKERDRAKRSVAPARRVTGRKMTPDLAQQILTLHQAAQASYPT